MIDFKQLEPNDFILKQHNLEMSDSSKSHENEHYN